MPTIPDPAVLSRIDRLELEARQVVEGYLSGRHRSPRHGFAVEFAQHREYAPGDDIKHIDWKVYGRTERFHLKQYEQETNLVAWLLVDASESMALRLRRRARSTTSLAPPRPRWRTSCFNQTDSVGVAILAGGVRAFLRPSGQITQLREACRVMAEGPYPGPAVLGPVMNELAGRTGRRGIVFVFSDLLDDVPDILDGPAAPPLPEARGRAVPHARRGRTRLPVPPHDAVPRARRAARNPHRPARRPRQLPEGARTRTSPRSRPGAAAMEIDYVRLRTDADLGHDLAAYLQKRRAL